MLWIAEIYFVSELPQTFCSDYFQQWRQSMDRHCSNNIRSEANDCMPWQELKNGCFLSKRINQSKPVTPRRRWGIPTDASTVMVAHQCLSSATRTNGDTDWPVYSLMESFHDLCSLPLRRLPSTEPCSMIFGSVLWRRTWTNHDNLGRLTAEAPEFRLGPARKRKACTEKLVMILPALTRRTYCWLVAI